MATILEALQNARYNLGQRNRVGEAATVIAETQLRNAVTLLEKGYTIHTDIEAAEERWGTVEAAPPVNGA